MERIAFRPVRNSSGATMLVTSFPVSMILQVLFLPVVKAFIAAILGGLGSLRGAVAGELLAWVY